MSAVRLVAAALLLLALMATATEAGRRRGTGTSSASNNRDSNRDSRDSRDSQDLLKAASYREARRAENKAGDNKEDDEDKKTLSQQVAEGKYGLIQKELFSGRSRRPGVLSYKSNPEVPRDSAATLGGLQAEEIWLAEDHLLVLRGGSLKDDDDEGGAQTQGARTPSAPPWPPIDNYHAPPRQVKLPARPAVAPPFPVRLRDGGPAVFLRSANGSAPQLVAGGFVPLVPWNGTLLVAAGANLSALSGLPTLPLPVPALPLAPGNAAAGSAPFLPVPFPLANASLVGGPPPPHLLQSLPPGAAFLPPPPPNLTEPYDEDDPSIYYPPPYDFYYPKDNSSAVAPGPLVPGIILPPPPDFFGPLEPERPHVSVTTTTTTTSTTTTAAPIPVRIRRPPSTFVRPSPPLPTDNEVDAPATSSPRTPLGYEYRKPKQGVYQRLKLAQQVKVADNSFDEATTTERTVIIGGARRPTTQRPATSPPTHQVYLLRPRVRPTPLPPRPALSAPQPLQELPSRQSQPLQELPSRQPQPLQELPSRQPQPLQELPSRQPQPLQELPSPQSQPLPALQPALQPALPPAPLPTPEPYYSNNLVSPPPPDPNAIFQFDFRSQRQQRPLTQQPESSYRQSYRGYQQSYESSKLPATYQDQQSYEPSSKLPATYQDVTQAPQYFQEVPIEPAAPTPPPPPVPRPFSSLRAYSPQFNPYRYQTSTTPAPPPPLEYEPRYRYQTSTTPAPPPPLEYEPRYRYQTSTTPAPPPPLEYEPEQSVEVTPAPAIQEYHETVTLRRPNPTSAPSYRPVPVRPTVTSTPIPPVHYYETSSPQDKATFYFYEEPVLTTTPRPPSVVNATRYYDYYPVSVSPVPSTTAVPSYLYNNAYRNTPTRAPPAKSALTFFNGEQHNVGPSSPRAPVYEFSYQAQSVTTPPQLQGGFKPSLVRPSYNSLSAAPRPRPPPQQPVHAAPPAVYTTANPLYYYTQHDDSVFDDITKKYFSMFGRKLPSDDKPRATTPLPPLAPLSVSSTAEPPQAAQPQSPYSLATDTLVNYRRPLPEVDAESEPIRSGVNGGNAFISYRLPGSGGHFYFLTPQLGPGRPGRRLTVIAAR